MSNIQVFNPAQVPAFAKTAGLSSVSKALAGGQGQSGKRISIRGGVFRLVHDGKEVAKIDERHLDIVIVNAAEKISRSFYEGTYDEQNPQPPACWSADGQKPDASVKKPQGPNCVNCPQNQKGSGQGDSRACRFSQRLAVMVANDINEEGDVLQLSLPAASIFGKAEGKNMPLQEFARRLSAQGVDPTMVVTRLRFDTNFSTPKLFFEAQRWLTDGEFAITREKGASEDAIKAITFTVSQTDGVQSVSEPAPLTGKPPAAARAEPAPAAEPQAAADGPDDEPPPTVRKATPPAAAVAAAVPQRSNVAQALAEWDDN